MSLLSAQHIYLVTKRFEGTHFGTTWWREHVASPSGEVWSPEARQSHPLGGG